MCVSVHAEITPVHPEALPFPTIEKPTGWLGWIRHWIVSHFCELWMDFSETVVEDEDSADDDPEGDPLTVRKLVFLLNFSELGLEFWILFITSIFF